MSCIHAISNRIDARSSAIWGEAVTTGPVDNGVEASRARKQGLGPARGLLNGLIFTLGLWLALTGFFLLIFR